MKKHSIVSIAALLLAVTSGAVSASHVQGHEVGQLDPVRPAEAPWDRGTFLRVFRPELAWPAPLRPAPDWAIRLITEEFNFLKTDAELCDSLCQAKWSDQSDPCNQVCVAAATGELSDCIADADASAEEKWAFRSSCFYGWSLPVIRSCSDQSRRQPVACARGLQKDVLFSLDAIDKQGEEEVREEQP